MKATTGTLTIKQLSHEGRGIGIHPENPQGKTVFVQNALPNETVSFRYLKHYKQFDEGITTEVLENPHPNRVKPLCPHTDICAGCSLQHMSSTAQLALKENTLKDHFKHFAKIDISTLEPAIHHSAYHYRHKARLSVKEVLKKNKLLIGFHEHNGRYVADIDSCVVLEKSVGEQLPALKTLISTLNAHNAIPQIEVAVADHETALILRHVQPLIKTDLEKIIAFAQEKSFSIYLQASKQDRETLKTVQALWGNDILQEEGTKLIKLWPVNTPSLLHYRLPEQDCTLYFSPTEFTQINPAINQRMLTQALAWLAPTPEDKALDLFCGIGNFTLPLARLSKNVVGVEGTESMVLRGQYNAQENHVDNIQFLAADLNQSVSHFPLLDTSFDCILLDPPRSGALQVIETHFKTWQAKRIVYISCNPATLARDAGILVHQLGYRLEKIGILDMFPHTTHVESMALFTRKG